MTFVANDVDPGAVKISKGTVSAGDVIGRRYRTRNEMQGKK